MKTFLTVNTLRFTYKATTIKMTKVITIDIIIILFFFFVIYIILHMN